MNRCKECGNEIDEYQYNTFNQLCPECVRELKRLKGIKSLKELIQYRNEIEGAYFLLAFTSFVIGIFTFLIYHPLLILLSIIGLLFILLSIYHNKKTRKLRKWLETINY